MTIQLGSGKILDITEVKIEVAEINKIGDGLYDRPFIPTPVITKITKNRSRKYLEYSRIWRRKERKKRKH